MWTFDPWVFGPLALLVTFFVAGFANLIRTSRAKLEHLYRLLTFCAALGVLAIALVSPLDALGDSLFSAHMAQHMILMLPGAFRLVIAAPFPLVLLGVPTQVRRAVTARAARSRNFRLVGGWLITPWIAASIQMIVLWVGICLSFSGPLRPTTSFTA